MLRPVLGLAAAVALGGCNAVTTPAPLFPAESGVLKPGVWRADLQKDCVFDDGQPVASWPDCAAAPIIAASGGGRMSGQGEDARSLDLRLVRGDPLIVEVTTRPTKGEAADFKPLTLYLAGRAIFRDAKGRATAAELWLVQCGPPEQGAELTRRPLPGLTLDPQAKSCSTDQGQALRDAAAASQAWAGPEDLLRISWRRDNGP